MNRNILTFLTLIIFWLLPAGFILSAPPKSLEIKPLSDGIAIDGKLDETVYQNLSAVDGFVQYHPNNGLPPTFKTEVYAFYDKKYLYFAFRCFDNEPGKITADVAPFGQYFNNDEVQVFIDTFRDKRTYKIFGVNPRGIKKGEATIWDADAAITDFGWSAEIRIPFKSLRFPVDKIQQWHINFKRDVFRLNETSYWTHVERDRMNVFGDTFGEMRGIRNIQGGKNIELFPYAGYRRSTSRQDSETDQKFAYGLDLKYGITSNLTLDLTSSPDYSEVESDPFFYQISPFEFGLEENRPFYSEGRGYFETPFELFYSRRIRQPNFAAKVTGKEKGYSLGALFAQDEQPGSNKNHTVFRLKKDIFKLSHIGVIYSSVEEPENWNRNVGLDFSFKFKDVYRFSGMAAFSFNKDMPTTDNGMYQMAFHVEKDRGLNFFAIYNRVEPSVHVPAGFIPDVDYERLWLACIYSFRWEKQWLEHLKIRLFKSETRSIRDHLSAASYLNLMMQATTRDRLRMGFEYGSGSMRARLLDDNDELLWEDFMYPSTFFNFSLSYAGSSTVQFGINGSLVKDFVYSDDFTETRAGRYNEIVLWTDLKFSPQLLVKLGFEKIFYHSRDDMIRFNGNIISSTFNYQINSKVSAFTKIQYDSYLERFGYDFLIGYEPANVSKIYISLKNYSEQRLRFFHPDANSMGLKFSYLFRI